MPAWRAQCLLMGYKVLARSNKRFPIINPDQWPGPIGPEGMSYETTLLRIWGTGALGALFWGTSGNPNSLKALRSDCSLRLVSQCCCTAQKHGHCMTKAQEKSLDGTYTKMLRMVLGVTWKDKVSNAVLYGKLPRLKAFRQYRN